MKTYITSLLLLALVFVSVACSHVRAGHVSEAAAATIVVERPENNGSVNILPCTIAFSSGQKITLSGGETATTSVSAGFLWVEASSVDPYHPETTDLGAWRSRRVEIRLRPGEVLRLSVEPKSRGSTYVGGWSIQRTACERSGVDTSRAARLQIKSAEQIVGDERPPRLSAQRMPGIRPTTSHATSLPGMSGSLQLRCIRHAPARLVKSWTLV
jgi:hypothetical protein